jgi:hypothetical protein
MNKHFIHRDTAHMRPKREGLDYIRRVSQEQFDFQSSKGYRKPAVGVHIVRGQIASPWATVPGYTTFQALSALAGSAD